MKNIALILAIILLMGCETAQREAYLRHHPELAADETDAIKTMSLKLGLPEETVRIILGDPQKTYGYKKDGKILEYWVYSEYDWNPYTNVLLENGKLISWNMPDSVKQRLDKEMVEEIFKESWLSEFAS